MRLRTTWSRRQRLVRLAMAWGTQVPWGPEGSLELALPEGDRSPGLVRGRLARYKRPARRLCGSPGESPGFSGRRSHARRAGGSGSTVAIVVDDPSRWTPVREALPILLRGCTQRGFALRM